MKAAAPMDCFDAGLGKLDREASPGGGERGAAEVYNGKLSRREGRGKSQLPEVLATEAGCF